MAKRKKPLKRGRDWHGWAWKSLESGLFWYATSERMGHHATARGKWVRVKFIEVK